MPQKLATNLGTEKFHRKCHKKFHTSENLTKQRLCRKAQQLEIVIILILCAVHYDIFRF